MATMFKRHIFSTIFLGLYIIWWILFIYWFNSGSSNYPKSCGAANGTLVILTLLIAIIYTFTLFIKIVIAKGQSRWDYIKFLGIILLPAIILIVRLTIVTTWTRLN